MIDLSAMKSAFIGGRTVRDRFGRYFVITSRGVFTMQAYLTFMAVYRHQIGESHRLYNIRIYDREKKKYDDAIIRNAEELKKELKKSANAYFLYELDEEEKQRKLDSLSDQELASLVIEEVYDNRYDANAASLAILDNVVKEKIVFSVLLQEFYMANYEDTDIGRIMMFHELNDRIFNNDVNIVYPDDIFIDETHPDLAEISKLLQRPIKSTTRVNLELYGEPDEVKQLKEQIALEGPKAILKDSFKHLLLTSEENTRELLLEQLDHSYDEDNTLLRTSEFVEPESANFGLTKEGKAISIKLLDTDNIESDSISKNAVQTTVKFIDTQSAQFTRTLEKYKTALKHLAEYMPEDAAYIDYTRFKENYPNDFIILNNIAAARDRFSYLCDPFAIYDRKDIVNAIDALERVAGIVKDAYPSNSDKPFVKEVAENDMFATYVLNRMDLFGELEDSDVYRELSAASAMEASLDRATQQNDIAFMILDNVRNEFRNPDSTINEEALIEFLKKEGFMEIGNTPLEGMFKRVINMDEDIIITENPTEENSDNMEEILLRKDEFNKAFEESFSADEPRQLEM